MSTNQLKLAGALTLTAFLAACGGAENDFREPGLGLGASNECNVSRCVTAEFTLAPTEGLGFQCGIFNGVTNQTGTFRCLPGDRVRVFVGDPDGSRQIFFGDALIDGFEQNTQGNIFNGAIRRITALDLTSSGEVATLDGPSGTAAINVIRLLDAINVSEVDDANGNFVRFVANEYVEGIPINQISIPLRLREAMSELIDDNLTTEDFLNDDFIDKTEDWLSEFGLAVTLTSEQAAERLNQALNVSVAGLYFGLPSTTLTSGLSTTITGSTSASADALNVAMEIYGLQNRASQLIGQGMYWNSSYVPSGSNTPSAPNLPGNAIFDRMSVAEDAKIDPISKNLTEFDWSVDTTRARQTSARRPSAVSFYQGKLVDNRVIFGSQLIYEQYAGEQLIDPRLLGRWRQFDSSGTQSGGGDDLSNATIFSLPSQSASSFLQPSIWITRTAVEPGEKYIFPLSVTANMSFQAQNGTLTPAGSVGLLILEDGNVWTDGGGMVNPDFGALGEPNCSIDPGLDKPVGYVRVALDQITGVSTTTGSFINPVFLLNGDEFAPGLDGAQVGAGLDGTTLTINIDSLVRATSSQSGSGSILARGIVRDENNVSSLSDPEWTNTYNANLSLYVATQESQGNSIESDLEGIEDRIEGTFSMALSSCDGGGGKQK